MQISESQDNAQKVKHRWERTPKVMQLLTHWEIRRPKSEDVIGSVNVQEADGVQPLFRTDKGDRQTEQPLTTRGVFLRDILGIRLHHWLKR